MKWMTNSRKLLFAGAALAASFGLVLSAQAQTCTIANWSGSPVGGLNDTDNANKPPSNPRYAGPCSLEVPVAGSAAHVIDNSPTSDTGYIVRFYTFLEDAGTNPMIIFEANDADDGAGTSQILVRYNDPTAGDLTLEVFHAGGSTTRTFAVGNGWHSVEFDWEAAASASIAFTVDGQTDLTITGVDTSGITIESALLGNITTASGGAGAVAYFDDFDSRRSTRPGRLCRGDTDGNNSIGFADLNAVGNEVISGGTILASGQPDYDENGAVGFSDLNAVFSDHVQIANSACVF